MQQLFKVIDTRDNSDVMDNFNLEAIALNEEWAKDLVYCDMQGWYIDEWGDLMLLDECGSYRSAPDHYQVQFNKDALTAILAKLEG